MKVGIIICTDDCDTCFVAVRYAAFHLMEQKEVNIYFLYSDLNYEKSDNQFNIRKLVGDFEQSGGMFYRINNRDLLKDLLSEHFRDLVQSKQIDNMCYNDKFQSIMTSNVYIRKFIGSSV